MDCCSAADVSALISSTTEPVGPLAAGIKRRQESACHRRLRFVTGGNFSGVSVVLWRSGAWRALVAVAVFMG
jgi:hypothetical protein